MKNEDRRFHLNLVQDGKFRLYQFPKGNIIIPRKSSLFSISDLHDLFDCIILGEPGSGMRRCYEWFTHSQTTTPSVIVKTNFSPTSIDIIGEVPEDRKNRAVNYIKSMNNCANQDDLFQVFLNWHNVMKKETCHLIFFNPIDTLASHLGGALRKLRENYENKMKITIFSTTDESFYSSAVQSGYIDYCNMFRLARLPASEAKVSITDSLQPNTIIKSDCLQKIIDNTGGHPTLIEHHIELIKNVKQKQNKLEITHADIDLAFDLLPNSVTRITDIWRQTLKELCTKNPLLKNSLANYLSNSIQQHRPIPPEDRQLFITGWLGFDIQNNWGIVSRFHKNLIRKLLMEG